jgi:hypothetical protein
MAVKSAASLSRARYPAVGPLVRHCVAFLNVPLITCEAVEGIQIRQPPKSRSSAKQLHRPSAVYATRRFGRGLDGVVHDTISNSCHSDVVREHYRRVAGSLTFGKAGWAALPKARANSRCLQSAAPHDKSSLLRDKGHAQGASQAALYGPGGCHRPGRCRFSGTLTESQGRRGRNRHQAGCSKAQDTARRATATSHATLAVALTLQGCGTE